MSAYSQINTKIGRNDLCPCGSGKKYKKCCSRLPREDGTKNAQQSKFRFESGSYGDKGDYMPSIACLKLDSAMQWDYYFVLVDPTNRYAEEDTAVEQAEADLALAFGAKTKAGSDEVMALVLREKGYVNVKNFNIVRDGEAG